MTNYTPAPGYKWNAVLIILRHGNEMLLLRRKKQPNEGLYVPPGGKIEPYERPRDTAARECEEETGHRPETLHFLGVISETSPTQYNWTTFVYWADSERFDPPELDEGDLAWISFDEAFELPAPVTAKPLYEALLEGRNITLEVEYNEKLTPLRMRDELTNTQFIGTI